jgi:hypothetical protein
MDWILIERTEVDMFRLLRVFFFQIVSAILYEETPNREVYLKSCLK